MLNGIAKVKQLFFDTAKVRRLIDERTRSVLSRFGAFVRRAARSSIRPRKRASEPGKPPSSHTGFLRENIQFAYDPRTNSVIIGPTAGNQVFFDRDIQPVHGIVPQILEYGGEAGVIEVAVKDVKTGELIWKRRDLRLRGKVALVDKLRRNLAAGKKVFRTDGRLVVGTDHHRFRTYRVQARPYMAPAFDNELTELPGLWAGADQEESAA